MAGERYAKLTLRAAWSWIDNTRAAQTEQVKFKLGGTWRTYRRGAGGPASNEFVVPDPNDVSPDPRQFVMLGMQNLVTLLRLTVGSQGLSYSISNLRDAGDDSSHVGQSAFEAVPWPIVEFDITAAVYDRAYDLDFSALASTGWTIVSNVTTIRPVLVTVNVVNATVFGTATGSIELVASNGNNGVYSYVWDDPTVGNTPVRYNVPAGKYACLVTDTSGASVLVPVIVLSDPLFAVAVQNTDTTIDLVATGGLPPYAYQWDDGPTTASRQNLVAGTYSCLVTEGRGLTKRITVTLAPYRYHWSRNAITLELDAGPDYRDDPTLKPNLSFLCEVWLETTYLSGVFSQIGITLEQPADVDGRTTFDVQALLAAYLDYHVPALDATTVQRADPLFRRFFLKHAEQFGEVPVPAPATAVEPAYVVHGGLNFYEARARTWFTTYQPARLPFLSWEPATRYVLADQPEFLYYMVQQNPTDFAVRLRVGFGDNTHQDFQLTGQAGVRDFEVYCLPAGYQALGLASLSTAARPVTWWEVAVVRLTPGPLLSETRRFELDRRNYPHRRYFLYATSLGGMATYAALGEAQLDAEVTGEEATLTLPPAYDVLAGDVAVQERALRPLLKVAAGKRTRAELAVSQDLLLSRRVLLAQGARWLPGYLKTKTVNVLDEGKLVQTQDFEFYLTTERLYTPAL